MKSLINILKQKKGVTLIELLVVVVILGIISAVAIPAVMGNQTTSYKNTNEVNRKIVQEAVARYAIEHGGTHPINAINVNSTVAVSTGSTISFAKLTETTGRGGQTGGTAFGPYLQEKPTVYNSTTGATLNGNWTVNDKGIVALPVN